MQTVHETDKDDTPQKVTVTLTRGQIAWAKRQDGGLSFLLRRLLRLAQDGKITFEPKVSK